MNLEKYNFNEFVMYTTPDGKVKIQTLLHDENIWLPQKRIAELFGVERSVITKHLQNIYEEGELDKNSTCANFAQVQKEGSREVKRDVEFYNLDAIISVGYRVNSSRATQFRIWATARLKEYIIKGFTMDDERLANGQHFGKDYFKELLERIRSIRASERRIYQQITDIFAECSTDYNPKSQTTQDFYATVQNKFHFAITGKTAAEIVYDSADSEKANMGLATWKKSPEGRILKSDTNVAKNYLEHEEIRKLERTVSSFFDYIEGIIERRTTFTMESFATSVNKFLSFNEYEILEGKGSISQRQAEAKAFSEYEIFNTTQKIDSDFDKHVKRLQKKDQESEQ